MDFPVVGHVSLSAISFPRTDSYKDSKQRYLHVGNPENLDRCTMGWRQLKETQFKGLG